MGEAFTNFTWAVPHPPAQLASVVVRPYHVAQKLEHLIIKDNNGANILTVKFCLHFTQKYYAVNKLSYYGEYFIRYYELRPFSAYAYF